MTKQQTLIQRFWHHVIHTPSKVAVVADRKETPGDLPVPIMCPCVTAWSSMTPYMYYYPTECHHYAPVSHLSYHGLGRNTAELMSFLSDNGFTKGQRAVIISENRREAEEADMAIQSLGGISVPIFAHMSAAQAKYIINDSGASFAIVENHEQLAKIADIPIAKILIEGTLSPEEKSANIESFKDIYARNKANKMLLQVAQIIDGITLDDIARIFYSSGTTGAPKGVMLSHGNISWALINVSRHGFKWREDDLYLSALPVSHVYGCVNGQYLARWCGMPVAFCKITQVGEALKLFQPTILLGVPKLWRKMRDVIEAELMKAKGRRAKIIKWAFGGQKTPITRWLADILVFGKIRERLGGRLRIAMSGGAALSPDVQDFFAKLGITLCQGYGMTETTGAISAALPGENDHGSSGRIFDFCDLAIIPHENVPTDLGAGTWEPLVTRGSTSCRGPQAGEIWIKGPQVFKGYWGQPEATAKVMTKDGWFKTGDAGITYDRNYLCVVGRVARVIKNENGKWIPVDLIEEAVYAADQEDQISAIQIIVPIAGSQYKFTGALVFVDPNECRILLEQNGIKPSASELSGLANPCAFYARHPLVRQQVVEAIQKANEKLEAWERIKRIQIVEDEATVDGGHLTPTLKVKAEAIRRMYKTLEDSLYKPASTDALAGREPIDI